MKIILVLAIAFGFSLSSFSQDDNEIKTFKEETDTIKVKEKWSASNDVKFGIRGGYNISNLNFEAQPLGGNKHRNSIYLGFLANVGLSRTWSILPEIQFSAEGANTETLHLDYIQIPVLLRFRLSKKFYLGAGPQAGWKVQKSNDNLKHLAYSAVVGANYKISYTIFADIRYNYGLRNVFDESFGFVGKNRTIQLGLGYKL